MGFNYFNIQPIAGRIGAEIVGIDLSQNPSDDLIAEIRKALIQYKVIFFSTTNLRRKGSHRFCPSFWRVDKSSPHCTGLLNGLP
jgi:taurine dioxygenase